MPGKGHCFFAPPVVGVNPSTGLPDNFRPVVLGFDFCSNYVFDMSHVSADDDKLKEYEKWRFCPRCEQHVPTIDDGLTCGRCKLVLPR